MKHVFIIIVLLGFGCSKKQEIVEKHLNGAIKAEYFLEDSLKVGMYKEYDVNGNLKMKAIYDNGKLTDSAILYYESKRSSIKSIQYWKSDKAYFQKNFYENGNLKSEGNLLRNDFPIGKWNFYSREKYKKKVIEFLNIRQKPYENQIWEIDKNGDTIDGIYYEIYRKDKATYNEPYRIHLMLKQRLLPNSEASVYIPKKGFSSNADFADENKIKWLRIDNVAKWHKDFPDRKHDVILSVWPKKVKHDTLRGYLIEKEILKNTKDFDSITRKTYFNISFDVELNNNARR